MKLQKTCVIGGLPWAKALALVLLLVVLLYPNGMTGKALIQEKSALGGIVALGNALRVPGPEQGQAARLLAGLSSDLAAGGSLQVGPWSGKLHLPLIHKNFNPALFAVVPYVLNLTQAAAEAAILAAQLTLGTVTQQPSPTVPAGSVMGQSPGAGLYVAKGTAVNLVISTGPGLVNVPNVVNQPQAVAEGIITAVGLQVGTVTPEYSDTVDPGNITRQSPLAATSVPEETAVNLWVSLGPQPIPPDPGTVAPPIDPTVATTLAKATEFLYTGATPIQDGVTPGTIEAKRAAVIRGKVLDRDGQPLPGATVTIFNHPEFGQTLTRLDGMFDMAVNGGGYLTVKYQKNGYLEVQRQLNVPWQDYVWAPDVVLIGLDGQTTAIDLNAGVPFQVARGSVTSDNRGTRQSTLLFAQGTQAELVLPNGTTQPISNLTVRSTEYTVGENGPDAMPGDLPLGIGYTYAVELTVEEALAAGASGIRFSQPVVKYVENFLGFGVGGAVPAYYYDRKQGLWVPLPNGRVIKILGSTGGMADLDVDGDDLADTGTKLTDLGITNAERQRLTGLYSAEQSLWRVALLHFSPVDLNWPRYVGEEVYQRPPEIKPERDEDDPCTNGGSIIECQNQNLGESIPLVGTPFTLNYRSGRLPGRAASDTLVIPLTGSNLYYDGLFLGVELRVRVAGRRFSYSYPSSPNLSHTFTWDGLDAYGRKVQGAQPILISKGYKYVGIRWTAPGQRTFVPGTVDTFWRDWPGTIGHWDFGKALAGWTMSIHHNYDPVAQTLYLGNGEERRAINQALVVDTVAGNGQNCFESTPCGDGGLATDAQMVPWAVGVGADESLYITDNISGRIRRVWPNGIITNFAGNMNNPWCDDPLAPCGDGGPATQASFGDIYQNVVGPDGSLYIADPGINRIRKVSPEGIITTIAGTGELGFGGDGGPATQAKLNDPYGVRVAPDGTVYIADEHNLRIRRIGTDGIITTVAGNGTGCEPWTDPCGDGGPATQASVGWPLDIAVGSDGSLYIPVQCRIRKVSPDGTISTVAGTGECGFSGDGGPALDAKITGMFGIAVAPDGGILFTDNNRIRRIGPDGIISTIAGKGYPSGYGGDNGPATAANFKGFWYLAFGPNGHIYIADDGNFRLRRLRPLLPGFTDAEIVISSPDGKELYIFDRTGRHLRTVNTLTGTTVYQFSYDPTGLLISVQNLDGNNTSIERDGSGNPTAIIGPYGQRTNLTIDANGYLSGITNPAGGATAFQYTVDGLLTRMTTPRGHSYTFTYDSLGRLIRDDDPAGGSQSLAKTEFANGYEITKTTAMGRTTNYRVENLPTGDKKMTNTFPDGTQTTSLLKTDGTQTTTSPDGTATTIQQGPDPRFGMQSPVPKSMTVLTPGGLTYSLEFTRSVSLSDANDPLSLTSLTHSMTVNNRTYQSLYSAATREQTSTSPQGRLTVTTLDALGRVVKKERAGIDPISLAYDASGRLTTITQGTAGNLRNITLSYNPKGYVSSVTDPLSRTASFEYDQAGRVTRQVLPGSREVLYGYDTNGNMTSITPLSRPSHAFDYTSVDAVKDYTPPPAGPDTGPTTYTYNADRQLTRVTRPDGKTIDLAYDTGGRLSARTIQRGTTSYAYNAQTGNISTITAPDGGMLSFTYDDSLLKGVTWQGAVQGSLGLSHDNDRRVVSQSVNGGDTVNFAYDNDSLLTQAGAMSISRNAQNGLITGTTLGVVTDSRTYTSFGELSDYSASTSASEFFSDQYTRDKLGRVTDKTETISGTSKTYTYLYDAAGRLAEVKENGATVAAYTYDTNGNRITANTGIPVIATYDDQDRLLQYGNTTYAYTGNGELAGKNAAGQATTYQYDELGNLVAVVLPNGDQIAYVIDGRNRRIGKKINNVLTQGWLYKDRINPVAELDGSGAVVSRFVYGAKKNVPDYMYKGGATYRIISDHLGSVRLVVDAATGTIAQRLDYDAFGKVVFDSSPGFQPFGFAGGLYDQDTKLTRFGVRDYDADTGRWTAKDPIRFAGGSPNLYGYVRNNPINRIDPIGLEDQMDKEDQMGVYVGNGMDIVLVTEELSPEQYDEMVQYWEEEAERLAEERTRLDDILDDISDWLRRQRDKVCTEKQSERGTWFVRRTIGEAQPVQTAESAPLADTEWGRLLQWLNGEI